MKLSVKKTSELSVPELLEITKARIKVFVVEQECPYQEIDDQDDDAIHMILRVDGELAAYTRIIRNSSSNYVSFGRVLVVKKFRKQHLGREIVSATIEEIKEDFPGNDIKIAGQSYLLDFYKSFGFKPVSDVYLEDGIPHVDLVLKY
ncbi:GNAT family acetyltransferase [Secundilactobacillus silagincola]|uniref:GNAT family acetyltransferase n=1 Tax=Secundilactobacillus silagincola TaxID=1714681 RepID=A0A1Z5J0R0_9LACO|nr:GNAT family N-acetyltransferase [Secundilactobacillus silagincola]GAX07489.1 GNAT family acetyltransferase [Secundilactobacillus silagincola]